jgi:hypothetical protein
LPDQVVAPLLRALMTLPAPRHSRLALQRAPEPRPPFWDNTNDFMVMWQGHKVGRIDLDPKPYPHQQHVPWRWFLNDEIRSRMADGRCATREEAMLAFRAAWERVPDKTVEKSA